MNNPLVSILVPVYNVEAYLPQCLDSLLGQTYPHLQIVLIDDGSSDNSWVVMQQYAAKDNRIEIYHQENQGVAVTRNHLLEKIKGDFVLFVDSDDWVELHMIECMLSLQNEYKTDVVVCSLVKNNGEIIPIEKSSNVRYSQSEIIKAFCEHTWLSGSLCNKLVRTSLLHNTKFHCGISYGEDALFCWNLLQYVSNGVLVTNAQFYHYRMNDNSISHQVWNPQKKGTGTIVWRTIVQECEQLWPQFVDIARARYAIEDMWGLYFASLSGYPLDEHIKSRQENVRKHLGLMRKSGLINYKKILVAYVLSYCYRIGALLKYI